MPIISVEITKTIDEREKCDARRTYLNDERPEIT